MIISIRKLTFESEFFSEQLAKSRSLAAFAKSLGFDFCNGSLGNELKTIIDQLKLSTKHFKLGQERKYPLVNKNCPICNVEFTISEGAAKQSTTCSTSCANKYFTDKIHTEESKAKRSQSLKEHYRDNPNTPTVISKICPTCNENFEVSPGQKKQKCCSKECSLQSEEYRQKLSDNVKQRIANGTHNGWAKRDNLEPSYPEKYVINILIDLGYTLQLTDGYITNYPKKSNNIIITRESKASKWFIDFADLNRKLALEIDGKQHELPERKASDEVKDKFLTDNGWTVLRIKWRKIDKDFREYLIDKIETFFK